MRNRRVLLRHKPAIPSAATLLPVPNDGLGLACSMHYRGRAVAISSQQNNLGPPDMLLRDWR
jgi:hypothetical protein